MEYVCADASVSRGCERWFAFIKTQADRKLLVSDTVRVQTMHHRQCTLGESSHLSRARSVQGKIIAPNGYCQRNVTGCFGSQHAFVGYAHGVYKIWFDI